MKTCIKFLVHRALKKLYYRCIWGVFVKEHNANMINFVLFFYLDAVDGAPVASSYTWCIALR